MRRGFPWLKFPPEQPLGQDIALCRSRVSVVGLAEHQTSINKPAKANLPRAGRDLRTVGETLTHLGRIPFPVTQNMRHLLFPLILSTCLSCLTTLPAFAQGADMTEEELSRMTGVDPLWVHITPCLARSTIEQSLARQRADGVTLDQMREQLADQVASNPDFNRFITNFYGLKEGEIPTDIRQRHVACVAQIIGAPVERVDACYIRDYAPFLQTLFGPNPRAANQLATRIAYVECLKDAQKNE